MEFSPYPQTAFMINFVTHGMLVNRRLKGFYSPRRHEEHEVLFLRVFGVRILLNFYNRTYP